MMNTIDSGNLDPKFRRDVAGTPGGENISLCFACGTCTAGCPVAGVDAQFDPRRIIRQVLLGMRQETLSSPALWRCVQCYSCTSKCPQNVRFRDIIRALREMAVKEGKADAGLPAETEELNTLVRKAHRTLATAMVADRTAYDGLKQKLQDIAGL